MTTPIATTERTYDIRESNFTGKYRSNVPSDSERNDGELDRLLTSALETDTHEGSYRLTEDDREHLASVLGHEISENTRVNYKSQWRRFTGWAQERDVRALPADPLQVAAYLAERMEKHGYKPATLQAAAAAIGFVHRTEGLPDPCETTEVRNTLRSARRKGGMDQRQAEGLTDEALDAIVATACLPRRWRGGRTESPEAAERRGVLDIAIVRVMRDALLRVSEAAELLWGAIEEAEDGTGRLLIKRSKTDPEGEGAVAFLSVPTMDSLRAIRLGAPEDGRVFGLRAGGISRRIRQAALAAGLGDGFSGHSPRVGMARDLARTGTALTRLMTAGRWRSPRMPALYTRNETVARGAVAHYYGSRGAHPSSSKVATKECDRDDLREEYVSDTEVCSVPEATGESDSETSVSIYSRGEYGTMLEPQREAGWMMPVGDVRPIRALIWHGLWGTKCVLVLLPTSLPLLSAANGVSGLSLTLLT